MTAISARPPLLSSIPPTSNVPKLSDFAGQGGNITLSPELLDGIANVTQERFDRLYAEGEKKFERLASMMEIMQEALKKRIVEQQKEREEKELARLKDLLSRPPQEPEELSKKDGEAMRKFFEKQFKELGRPSSFVTGVDSIIFGDDGWAYHFHKDGRVTRKLQNVLTPDQVQPTRQRANQLTMNLLSGIYDSQAAEAQRKVDKQLDFLGDLTDQEKQQLENFGVPSKPSISILA